MSANTTPLPRGVAQPATAGAAEGKPAAGVSATGDVDPGSTTGQEGQSGKQVTVDVEVFEAMKRQSAGQSALLRRLTTELDELKGRLGGKAEGEAGGKKEYKSPYMRQLAELNEFKAKLEAQAAEMLEGRVRESIYNGMILKGVDSKVAGLVAESLYGRIKDRVSTSKDALGRTLLELKGQSPEEAAEPLEAWLDAFMQSDEGKSLSPPEPQPHLRGVPVRRGVAPEGKIRITKEQMRSGQFDAEAMAAGRITVIE